MAHSQAKGSAEAYHAKNKSAVKEMHNTAHHIVNKPCHQQGAVTAGCIEYNAEPNTIKFLKKHDWSGQNKEAYPQTIRTCHSGKFVHSAHCGGRSDEAAVVYDDECGSGWLLAWSVKDLRGSSNKVYVETGPIENYMNINWSAVKAKLDKSCDTCFAVDGYSGYEAFAEISCGGKAKLVACFSSVAETGL